MRVIAVILAIVATTQSVFADLTSIDILGANARGTGLNGSGVVIGMVEKGRPGDPDKDLPANYHSQVNPTQVYAGSSVDTANSQFVAGDNGQHAIEVAGVIIASNTPNGTLVGIAPGVALHAAADRQTELDVDFAVAADRLARVSGMRAINVSYGRGLQALESTDGNVHRTQFVDWSTSAQDVLYVVAAGEDFDSSGLPEDNFNGITVGASQTLDGGIAGSFRQSWPGNLTDHDPPGVRTAIDLLAPGFNILLANRNDMTTTSSGTSYAAPHVTGAVALLQQFANTQANAPISDPRFINRNYEQPEVMKALLLNSADKLTGVHGSRREIVNGDGNNWETTSAFASAFVSLDEDLGAGHLNVGSALRNLRPGEYDPGIVPRIGWDFGNAGGTGASVDYLFDQEVSGYVAITLAWDRRVFKTGDDDRYNVGDQFTKYTNLSDVLNDLNVYLLPANSNNLGDAITSSTTLEDNLEHIFFNVPTAGMYKIKVLHSGGIGDDQDYGIAWWAGEITPGDFDGDGDVDGNDLSQWEDDYGMNGDSDADGDGDSDGEDFLAWQRNYGIGTLSATTAVPEPGAGVLAMIGLVLSIRQRG